MPRPCKHTLSSWGSSAKSTQELSAIGAHSEGKLLKIHLAGKYYNLHMRFCWEETPCAWAANQSFLLCHTATTLCWLLHRANCCQFKGFPPHTTQQLFLPSPARGFCLVVSAFLCLHSNQSGAFFSLLQIMRFEGIIHRL